MCGLVALVDRLGSGELKDKSVIERMIDLQIHRGPDDRGYLFISSKENKISSSYGLGCDDIKNLNVALGFCRLSIQDLSFNGHQPMISKNKKHVLMMNGEIYNASSLKYNLLSKGHKFTGTSDTEVVLMAIIEYGFDLAISKLNGMFAIVYFDIEQSQMYLTRDPFGIKPLYFFFNSKYFACSSELKSFIAIKDFQLKLDQNKLSEFFLFRNNIQETLFKDISNLEPGLILKYNLLNNSISSKKYNFISSKASDNFENTLANEIEAQLISDVPIGFQLSGGVDSSLVSYFSSKKLNEKIDTWSIIFEDKKYSELEFIEVVKRKVNSNTHLSTLNSEYFFNNLEKITWHLEHPINAPNTVGIYMLCQEAKSKVKVLLSGEGSDELFAGYAFFEQLLKPFGSIVLKKILAEKFNFKNLLSYYKNETLRVVMSSAQTNLNLANDILINFSFESAIAKRREIYENLNGDLFHKIQKYSKLTYLPSILTRQDKMSMAHSIEARVPFLSLELADAAYQMSLNQIMFNKKKNKLISKNILKNISEKIFGANFSYRKKNGFGLPMKNFLSEKNFNVYFNERLKPFCKETEIFSLKKTTDLIEKKNKLSTVEIETLWTVITFEHWYSKFIQSN